MYIMTNTVRRRQSAIACANPDCPSTIQATKRYLQDFDRVQKSGTSDQELFDQMAELYPHWVANQSWLMFGFPQA
jgi:hypothetical protein